MEAMWLMLQQDQPDDYVVATGHTYSVREFVEVVFAHLGLDPEEHVRTDPRYYRPSEVDVLLGDASKAKRRLGWTPTVCFRDLAIMMTDADMELAEGERLLLDRRGAKKTKALVAQGALGAEVW